MICQVYAKYIYQAQRLRKRNMYIRTSVQFMLYTRTSRRSIQFSRINGVFLAVMSYDYVVTSPHARMGLRVYAPSFRTELDFGSGT